MRSWLPAIALGAVLATVALALFMVLQDAGAQAPEARADALARELRCPDCQGLSVADSPTRSAQEIRRQIDQLVADGATEDQVRAHFVARYGEWIRLAPSASVVWIIPFVVVLAATAGLVAWLAARPPPTTSPVLPGLSPEERRRLREEAEALDA